MILYFAHLLLLKADLRKIPLFLIFSLISKLAIGQNYTTNIQIKGLVIDASTQQPIVATLQWAYLSSESPMWSRAINNGVNGWFLIATKPQSITLKVQATGYHTISINLALNNLKYSELLYIIPLVKLIEHQSNKVFAQSTTKSGKVEQTPITSKGKSIRHILTAVDGITHKPIEAAFRLIQTNTGKVYEYQTSLQRKEVSIQFTEHDILAVEVASPNYQPFYGNLIIDKLDNLTHHDTISLIKTPVFFNAITSTNQPKAEVYLSKLSPSGNDLTTKIPSQHPIHYGLLELNEWYKVKVCTGQDTVYHTFQATAGMNQYVVESVPSLDTLPTITEPQKFILYFEQSNFLLKPESQIILHQIIQQAAAQPNLNIEIFGHTDNVGNYNSNLYLSEVRAMYVQNAFFAKGITETRIKKIAMGSKKPIANNNNETEKGLNRRVEIYLYPTTKK